jgi:hypothetical protein
MEKIFSKREEKFSSERVYAHQLITVANLKAFKNQLIEDLLTALKSQTTPTAKEAAQVSLCKKTA